jgi:hypothetical protein
LAKVWIIQASFNHVCHKINPHSKKLEQMPEWKEDPLHKALKKWPLQPIFIVEGSTVCQAITDMIFEL